MRVSYSEAGTSQGRASLMPYLDILLTSPAASLCVNCLVDSGSTLNVLPYRFGIQLGFDWASQRMPIQLSGALAVSEARAVIVTGQVGDYPPVRQAFAWSERDDVPAIVGQTNFFLEFDVAFFRSEGIFTVSPNSARKE